MLVAKAALAEISPDCIVGIGTGSTVDCLIDQLSSIECPAFFVSSSLRTTSKLQDLGYMVKSLNEAGPLDVYIDGADQVLKSGVSLKGGGGCHSLEKVLASNAARFVGIMSDDKSVELLTAPVTIEVLDEARSAIARTIISLGGEPVYREGKTDSGHSLLDLYQLDLSDPSQVERTLQLIVGVVEVGIFSIRRFDVFYVSSDEGVEKHQITV